MFFASILRLEKAQGAKHIPRGRQPRICERRATHYKRKRRSKKQLKSGQIAVYLVARYMGSVMRPLNIFICDKLFKSMLAKDIFD